MNYICMCDGLFMLGAPQATIESARQFNIMTVVAVSQPTVRVLQMEFSNFREIT